MPMPPLADALPFAADFMIEVLATTSRPGERELSWVEINRLAARWLRPGASDADTSRLGHAVVLEMHRHGLLSVEMTTAADGALMASRVSAVGVSAWSPYPAAA